MQRNEVKSTFSKAEQKIETLSAELQELSTGFVTNTIHHTHVERFNISKL